MTAFVTVGSTKFDLLVESVLSIECLGALERRGYGTLIIQYGNSQLPTIPQSKVSITAYKFKQSLAQDIRQADVVISHAGMRPLNWGRESTSQTSTGSGTIVDVLRASKPLIVVPNNTLMGDHQSELANELSLHGYLFTCSAG